MILKSKPTLQFPYHADPLLGFLDTIAGISGAGLDFPVSRLTDSHPLVLELPLTFFSHRGKVLGNRHATRKPLLLFWLSGLFLLRFALRQFLGLLFQEPPLVSQPHSLS